MKRLIVLLVILLAIPAGYAFDESVGGNSFLTAHFDNATRIGEERVSDANFTTNKNLTFHYSNAHKVTYRTQDGKMGSFITWKCNVSDSYYLLYDMHDLNIFYSDYTTSGDVVYMEIPMSSDYVYGIILDTENITYTEADLVYGILKLKGYALSNETYSSSMGGGSMGGGFSYYPSHYQGPVIEPYELARSDPWAYYDYFDYEDNVDIDEYLYDEGYDE